MNKVYFEFLKIVLFNFISLPLHFLKHMLKFLSNVTLLPGSVGHLAG